MGRDSPVAKNLPIGMVRLPTLMRLYRQLVGFDRCCRHFSSRVRVGGGVAAFSATGPGRSWFVSNARLPSQSKVTLIPVRADRAENLTMAVFRLCPAASRRSPLVREERGQRRPGLLPSRGLRRAFREGHPPVASDAVRRG